MYMGYRFATQSGISISVKDLVIPTEKQRIIQEAEAEVLAIEKQFASGLVTHGEHYNKIIDIWSSTN